MLYRYDFWGSQHSSAPNCHMNTMSTIFRNWCQNRLHWKRFFYKAWWRVLVSIRILSWPNIRIHFFQRIPALVMRSVAVDATKTTHLVWTNQSRLLLTLFLHLKLRRKNNVNNSPNWKCALTVSTLDVNVLRVRLRKHAPTMAILCGMPQYSIRIKVVRYLGTSCLIPAFDDLIL